MKRVIVLFFLLILITGLVWGQTTIYSQSFESNLDGYSHSPSQTPASDPGDQYFYRAEPSDSNIYENSVGPYTNVTGSWLFVGSNPNTINSSNPGELSFSQFSVSGYSNLEFHADFGACSNDWDSSDDLRVEYKFDDGSWATLFNFVAGGDGTNEPISLSGNASGGINTANGTTLTYNLTTISSDNFTGSGNTLSIRIIQDAGANYEAFGVDNILVKGISSSSVDNPSSFTATTYNSSQINLSWTQNGNSDDVMIVYNTNGSFDDPMDGSLYTVSSSACGGTVIFNGGGSSFNHTSLASNTQYFYKAWSVDSSENYSSGVISDATTLKNEPSNHVTSFSITANGYSEVGLSWTDATGTTVPDGYLIKGSEVGYGSIVAPSDGTPESDGGLVLNVLAGTESSEFTSLSAETAYYFKIYPYTNSGDDIDFKTDGTVPSGNATTDAEPTSPTSGDIYISEVCDDDAGGYQTAFMEIYNNTESAFNMENCYIERWQTGAYNGYEYVFGTGVTIPANGFLIVTRGESSQATFESAWGVDLSSLNSNYDQGHTDLYLTTGRGYKLYNASDVLLDETDGDVADSKRDVQKTIGSWTKGQDPSLGNPGELDNDQTLPVTLSSFSATIINGLPQLYWTTESETENMGWNVYRSDSETGMDNNNYLLLNGDLISGMGTTSIPSDYSFTDDHPIYSAGTYWYWLQSISYSGELEMYGPVSLLFEPGGNGNLPQITQLTSNYPNPFNPTTTIEFSIAENETGKLTIFNVSGQKIVEKSYSSGNHIFNWNAETQASGVYFYKLQTSRYHKTGKMVLMK